MKARLYLGMFALLAACTSTQTPTLPPAAEPFPPGAKLEPVLGGLALGEGPVWKDGRLLFSDIPANTVYALGPDGKKEVFLQPSNGANGHTLDLQGRLVSAEHLTQRVTRLEIGGKITVLADNYQGKKFNSPNDLVVKSDGSVWFTDPPWGLDGRVSETGITGVYRVVPGGPATLVSSAVKNPNGIAFSPDEQTLYISDSDGGHHLWAFPMQGSTLGTGKVIGVAGDGLRVDKEGRIWCAAGEGRTITIYTPDGKQVAQLEVADGNTTNLTWGGPDGKTLYVTSFTGVYRLHTNTSAAHP